MNRITITLLALVCTLCSYAQISKEEVFANINQTAGVYYAYPEVHEIYTVAPQGYSPFYISHFGRHGSRYLINDKDYLVIKNLLGKAQLNNQLTALGSDVLQRLEVIYKDAEGQGGELTALGYRQQRGIAQRMFSNFPEVFAEARNVYACATIVVRCVLSMTTFCEELKGLNPELNFSYASGKRHQQYLNNWNEDALEFTSNDSFWRLEYNAYTEEMINPDRLVRSLFKDANSLSVHMQPKDFMIALYWIASDMQNTDLNISLYDIFEKQELFDIWQTINYKHYVCNGTCPWGRNIVQRTFLDLWNNILDSANEAISDHTIAANFRFAHDGNLMPLVGMLQLDNCYNEETIPSLFYKAWSDFKIAPMAGNIQLIFYKNPNGGEVLVKFLHNEKEVNIPIESAIKPYYVWSEVEKYYRSKIQDLGEIIK